MVTSAAPARQPCQVVAAIDETSCNTRADVRELLAAVRDAGADAVKVMGTDRAAAVLEEAAGMDVLVAPCELEMVARLAPLPFTAWKIDPPLLTHLPLLDHVARDTRPILAGIAGCTRRELDEVVCRLPADTVLVHTVLHDGAVDVLDVAHLAALGRYGRAVGYADGGCDVTRALIAVALGAVVIEKPFAPYAAGGMPGLLPRAFHSLVAGVRRLEQIRAGDGTRDPRPDELDAIEQSRVSIVAARPIARGSALQRDMLALRPPGTGLPPRFLDVLEGRRVLYDIPEGTPVTFGVIDL